ncbi:MAG: hypothetical protein ACI8ZB_003275 [Desulforhopalus sp.]|jgi:hypothetical protein
MPQVEQNMISPPSVEICFCFKTDILIKLPGFLFLRLLLELRPFPENDQNYNRLLFWPDDISQDQESQEVLSLITYLQTYIRWQTLAPFVTLGTDSKTRIASMWKQKRKKLSSYRIEIRFKKLPQQIYRYTPFNQERLKHLFSEYELYLPSPSQFNDPLDCSLDDETRLTFIECGMGCFSEKNDDVLMFSHYADHHRGICLGFDPKKLATSMTDSTARVRADIRPIWYFKTMPPIDFKSQPALSATCKHDVWSYEKEHRLFLTNGSALLPSGLYSFNVDALTSIVFGCRATDKCISFIKSITRNITDLLYYKAIREPNRFGVKLVEIRKL